MTECCEMFPHINAINASLEFIYLFILYLFLLNIKISRLSGFIVAWNCQKKRKLFTKCCYLTDICIRDYEEGQRMSFKRSCTFTFR